MEQAPAQEQARQRIEYNRYKTDQYVGHWQNDVFLGSNNTSALVAY
jgi:hypothetical protein